MAAAANNASFDLSMSIMSDEDEHEEVSRTAWPRPWPPKRWRRKRPPGIVISDDDDYDQDEEDDGPEEVRRTRTRNILQPPGIYLLFL